MDEKPKVASSEGTPDEQAESLGASDPGFATAPADETSGWRDEPDEVLASIRRLRRLEQEKRRIPIGTSRFEAIVRTIDEAARELFRRAAGAMESSRASESEDAMSPDEVARTKTSERSGRGGRPSPDASKERTDGPGT